MTRPVDIPFKRLIQIDKTAPTAIYLQIASELALAIQNGLLPVSTKLPGSRALSRLLEVHRNTILAVYEELHTQGWVKLVPNKGTFVMNPQPDKIRTRAGIRHYPSRTGFDFEKLSLLDNPFEYTRCNHVFTDGTPDVRLTQIDDHSRFYSASMKRRSNRKKMNYFNQEGSEYFKKQLATYLNLSRGLRISTDNLLITRSMEMSLFILAEILLRPGDMVVVGTPGYFSANMSFQKSGAQIKTIPVDKDGIETSALRQLCKQHPVRMVYITPHHHYPTTVSLHALRRKELLQLAAEFRFVIVEDDYDYDFHYDFPDMLPMAASDTEGMIIYLGSFGKSLAPGFRTGFAVAPENLMREMRKFLGIVDRQGDILMEQALGEMIEEGVIYRHLKKSLKIYGERRALMAELLRRDLGDWLQFAPPSGGLAFWTTWKRPINLMKLSVVTAQNDLFIPKTLLYQNRELCAMRIGFGHLDQKELQQCMAILKDALHRVT